MTLHYNVKIKKNNKTLFTVFSLCLPFSLIKILKYHFCFSKNYGANYSRPPSVNPSIQPLSQLIANAEPSSIYNLLCLKKF